MGGVGATCDPENQVSRTGHVDFPILGNVTSRVVKSDFHENAMRVKCSDVLNCSEMRPGCPKHREFTLDCSKTAGEISGTF